MRDLLKDLWEESENKKDTYKIWKKIYHWLDCDNLGNIVLDGNTVWFELTCSSAKFPNYIYYYLIKWIEKKGYKYLYNIVEVN